MNDLPSLSRAEFDAIECNRCGDCCEGFYLPPRDTLNSWAFDYRVGGNSEDLKTADWFSHVHPTGKVSSDGSRPQYRCDYFVRDDSEHGTCTAYDKRPTVCSSFPYGEPVGPEFPRCSWRVTIRPDDIPLEVVS